MRALITAITFTCLSTFSSLSAADVEREIAREFDVDAGGTLSLDTDIGAIRVRTHSRDQLQVKVLMRANTSSDDRAEEIFDKFELKFDSSGDNVTVTGEHENRRRWWNNWNDRLRVFYDVTVPARYNLELDTSGGSIEIDDLEGTVNIHTSGGHITLGSIKGNVEASTSGGSIKAESIVGDVSVSTSGGNLRFNSIDGDLLGKTSGGSITAEFVSQIDDRIELRTSGGNIRVSLPGDMNANIEASTSGGHVSTELPMMISGRISHASLNGKLNNGGPDIILRTSGGNIVISEN